jgi:hypothetical protein
MVLLEEQAPAAGRSTTWAQAEENCGLVYEKILVINNEYIQEEYTMVIVICKPNTKKNLRFCVETKKKIQ